MCDFCGKNISVDYVVADGHGRRRVCPNHLLGFCATGRLILTPDRSLKDELTGANGAVMLQSVAFGAEQYVLSPDSMYRLINHSLYKKEWQGLVRNLRRKGIFSGYEELPYLLHLDFYTEDGTALQPAVTNRELKALYRKSGK